MQEDALVFENAHLRLRLSVDWASGAWAIRGWALKEAFEGPVSLTEAAEMAVIYQGLATSLAPLLAH
jgi:hypothetical protein